MEKGREELESSCPGSLWSHVLWGEKEGGDGAVEHWATLLTWWPQLDVRRVCGCGPSA